MHRNIHLGMAMSPHTLQTAFPLFRKQTCARRTFYDLKGLSVLMEDGLSDFISVEIEKFLLPAWHPGRSTSSRLYLIRVQYASNEYATGSPS